MPLVDSVWGNGLGSRRRAARPRDTPGRRVADREPMDGWVPTVAIGLGVAMLDWLSKYAVNVLMPAESFVEVMPGSLAFWHVRNPAMILGLYEDLPMAARRWIALGAALAGAALMLQVVACGHRLPRRQRPWAWLFVGLMLGGMLGNLGERMAHWGVTDFISLGWGGVWLPPGNLADLALFAAIPLAVLVSALEMGARTGRAAPERVMGD